MGIQGSPSLVSKSTILLIIQTYINLLNHSLFSHKTETYQINPAHRNERVHGYSGPLKVSYGGAFTNIGREFLDMAAKYDKSRPIVEDGNDFYTVDGYSVGLFP